VRDIGADRHVHGDGDAQFVRSDEHAGIGMLDLHHAAGEELAGSFAIANVDAPCQLGHFIQIFAGFRGHPELTGAKIRFDVFGSIAGESDLEVVDQGGAVHGDPGDKAAAHEVDQDGSEANLDDVAADTPQDRAALLARAMYRGEKLAQIACGEDVRERIEELRKRSVGSAARRNGEVAKADLALAGSERVSVQRAKCDGLGRIDAHGRKFTLRGSPRRCKDQEQERLVADPSVAAQATGFPDPSFWGTSKATL
jgi:hypothetical protein